MSDQKKEEKHTSEEPPRIYALNHNILRISSGVPFPSLYEQTKKEKESRFDICRHCKTPNPKTRTYCYKCSEVLLGCL